MKNPLPGDQNSQESSVPPNAASLEDQRKWRPLYPPDVRLRQKIEGWALFAAIILVIVSVFVLWRYYDGTLRSLALAGLGGLLGGLLQDAKFFYKSISDGNWIWEKAWWRLLTPVISGAMGFSVYLIVKGGFISETPASGKEDFYSYGIGFLTGLFADNALQKLRDIAYTLFGTPKDPVYKPKSKPAGSKDDRGAAGHD